MGTYGEPKRVNAKRVVSAERWGWAAPDAALSAREYGAQIMRDLRRWRKTPRHLIEERSPWIEPRCYGDCLDLVVWVGGGWGGRSRSTVASWLGGKRWRLTGEHRGNAQLALNRLALPEADGRLLVVGAPPKPAKGVVAWRRRWTVSRGALAGLVVVAGEGVESRALGEKVVRAEAQARAALEGARMEEVAAREAVAAAAVARERMARLILRLRLCGFDPPAGTTLPTYYAQQFVRAREVGRGGVIAAAVARWVEANGGAEAMRAGDGLAFGVRTTRRDGTPNGRHAGHRGGAYTGAMVVGTEAEAPDWDGGAHCGGGLHYAPLGSWRGEASAAAAVREARSYATREDVRYWIVAASAERVRIEHKAKARALTPLVALPMPRAYAAIRRVLGEAQQAEYVEGTLSRAVYQRERCEAAWKKAAATLAEWKAAR